MLLGDGGGSHVLVKDNVLVNPGQVGIGVAGGTDIRIHDNTVLGVRRRSSNVGIYVWSQGVSCSGIRVQGNTVDFAKASGARSGGFNHGNCGAVGGWGTNRWHADLRFDLLKVAL